jgi:hypothetical protein
MAKVSKAHAVAINKLMIPLINTVAGYIDPTDNDMGMFNMFVGDIAHNVAALDIFNKTLDAKTLHDNIMYQDTAPREHFFAVLKYIEENALIPANAFCCIR